MILIALQVYWSTKRKDGGDVQQQEAAPAAQLVRQGSGITEVSLLKGDKKNMDPAELIKVSSFCFILGSAAAGAHL